MILKDLLVHLDSAPASAERLALSLSLARRHGARLTGLFAESRSLGASLVGRRAPDNLARAARDTRTLFEAKAAEAGVSSRWWQIEAGEYAEIVGGVVVCCRYVDLAIFGQQRGNDAPVPEGLVERVIADCGGPVLVIPSAGHYADVGRRVLVAWTASREAARSLRDALPLLESAEEVTVLSVQEPSDDLPRGGFPHVDVLDHLRAHGIEARYARAVVGELGAVDMILNRACDDAADLTVIGAYGIQGSLRRGETTRTILETMTTPVLLSR
jgi:nucleotide-binding universal stress UspA family protein